jgi:hypothetical protein
MSQEPPVSPATASVSETATEILDDDWLAAPSRRSRSRIGLLAVLTLLVVFLGGVEVQKRWGAGDSATADRPFGRSFSGGSLPSGSFTGLPTTGGGTTASSIPAVIGTVTRIQGHTWTVRDLGGTSHAVQVTARTALTRSLGDATAPIRTGSDVTVQGTPHGRSLTATVITIR